MTIDLKALAEKNKQVAVDLTKPQVSGDYKPPEAGATRLRFVGYVETGTHEGSYKGTKKIQRKAIFFFELSGPKHMPAEFEGRKVPHIIRHELAITNHVKGSYIKLFNRMAQAVPGATNFLELLGQPYRGTVVHREYKVGEEKRVAAELKNAEGFTIIGCEYEDPETNELRTIKVDDSLTPFKVLLWDLADTAQWDSIFVDGTTDAGKTRNIFQEKIKHATDFVGSPVYEALLAAGRDAELVPAEPASKDEAYEADDGADGAKSSAVKEPAKALDAAEGDDPLAGTK